MDESEVASCIFIITGGNPAVLLQAMKKTFYNVAKFICHFVIRRRLNPAFPRANDRFCPLSSNLRSKGIRVIGSISNHVLTPVSMNQPGGLFDIMALSRRQDKTQGLKGITDGSIEFCRKAPSASTKCLGLLVIVFCFFFSGHPQHMSGHELSCYQSDKLIFHRPHGNVHGVSQRHPHRTSVRSVYRSYSNTHRLLGGPAKSHLPLLSKEPQRENVYKFLGFQRRRVKVF